MTVESPQRYTLLMREMERRFNYPLPALLRKLYDDLGSVQAVAEALSSPEIRVSHQTVWRWMRQFNIPLAEPIGSTGATR